MRVRRHQGVREPAIVIDRDRQACGAALKADRDQLARIGRLNRLVDPHRDVGGKPNLRACGKAAKREHA